MHRYSCEKSLAVFVILFFSAIAKADGFGAKAQWHDWFSPRGETPLVGDFNADGKTDIITFVKSSQTGAGRGDVYVALSNGVRFASSAVWHDWFCIDNETPLVGDFNGDGRSDIATLVKNTQAGEPLGNVWVALSAGNKFLTSSLWHDSAGINGELVLPGDVDGDRKTDLIILTRDSITGGVSGDVYVALSLGNRFAAARKWHEDFGHADDPLVAADVSGDGRTDLIRCVRNASAPSNEVMVTRSNGTAFTTPARWHGNFCKSPQQPIALDMDGDRKMDLLSIAYSNLGSVRAGDVFALFSSGDVFFGLPDLNLASSQTQNGQVLLAGDVDGDGRADLVNFVQSTVTSELGDVTVSLGGKKSEPYLSTTHYEEFGRGKMKVNGKMATGNRPVLMILMDFSDFRFTAAHSPSYFDTYFFGDTFPSLRAYFTEVSASQLQLSKAGLIGPLTHRDDPDTDVDETVRGCAFGDRTLCPGTERSDRHLRAEAVRLAYGAGFRFERFDINRDGDVTQDELLIHLVDAAPRDNAWGGTRAVHGNCVRPSGSTVRICAEVSGGTEHAGFATHAHEMFHVIGAVDLYGSKCLSSGLTLMSCTVAEAGTDQRTFHPDPWHKLQLLWTTPRVYSTLDTGTCQFLSVPQSVGGSNTPTTRPLLFYDPQLGNLEYLLLEYRNKIASTGGGYDRDIPSSGLAIWHVKMNPRFEATSVPGLRISSGDDKRLNSPIASGSDDFESVDANGNPVIDAGNDWSLQSRAYGDDFVVSDVHVFHRGASGFYRGKSKPWRSDEGIISPKWSDGRDSGLRIKIAPMNPGDPRIAVQWSRGGFRVTPDPRTISESDIRHCYEAF